jgi:hypothetical protein
MCLLRVHGLLPLLRLLLCGNGLLHELPYQLKGRGTGAPHGAEGPGTRSCRAFR